MSSEPAPRRRRLDRDERREQILRAARRLFSERHYAAVSTTELAHEAGVARGLLHHYFGTKRELFLDVVREMVAATPQIAELATGTLEERITKSVEAWLDAVAANEHTWLASIGAEGFGRDPEVEQVVDEYREATVDRVIEVLGIAADHAGMEGLRALMRSYGGLAEAATREWLVRRSLTRPQVERLLAETLLALVNDVLPSVRVAGRNP